MHIAARVAVETPAPNQRRVPREPVEVAATIRSAGFQGHDVVIRNISTLGFMADAEGEFDADAVLIVRLPSLGTVSARVIWARDGQIGCEFVNEIDLHRLRAVLATTGAAPSRRDRRPRLVS